ncbi:low molecular weight protein-tyrosine-phosphatase [Winogradskyella sediminis]|uniref:protein-tyrosine-phosphatase n=1 Tax=Winogradskyella sediminis TaxID=1382466 RepID=A0A1H1MB94_9FLAO|nr:low molecular weight protein-tyrosine-phosphatase [Winogradskyella sediminis]REG85924.1 protein-tyrosine phosphatase [Winogradskyella sediminis]SDR83249.1 protein-tyrosine phosphatase [Winogradskyella sediminis]
MTRILMVCLGNICRSPLAHGILQSKLPEDRFYVDSAGTAAYHIGNVPDKRSIAVANQHDLDISTQSARQFKVSDFDAFDIIYAMDHSNYEDIIRLARNSEDTKKVTLFLKVNSCVQNKNVPDPYYGSQDGFECVFKLINDTCDILAKKLNN